LSAPARVFTCEAFKVKLDARAISIRKEVLKVAHAVSERLACEGAEAVVVFGSQVREDAYKESDIDVHAIGIGPSYRLERFQGFLVSVSWATSRKHQRAFKEPDEVGGIIPAWRNALILYDPQRIGEKIKENALKWQWAQLGDRADRWVAEELTGWAEEVHRLIGNLQLKRRSAASVQRSVLAIHMAKVLSVHHRILYDSENRLWDSVSAKMGKQWANAQSTALGEHGESFEDTCNAALQLFSLAAQEVMHLLDKRQIQVVTYACKIAGLPL
jgi:predicted nucleotidyltransferase